MIGPILQMLAMTTAMNNTENLLKAISKGGEFEFDGGMLGTGIAKGLNKLTGSNLNKSFGIKASFAAAKSGVKSTIGKKFIAALAGGVGAYMFDPRVMAIRIALGMTYDAAKGHQEEQLTKNILDVPDDSNKYMLDERYPMISNTAYGYMEKINRDVNNLLNQDNLAGNIINQAFRFM